MDGRQSASPLGGARGTPIWPQGRPSYQKTATTPMPTKENAKISTTKRRAGRTHVITHTRLFLFTRTRFLLFFWRFVESGDSPISRPARPGADADASSPTCLHLPRARRDYECLPYSHNRCHATVQPSTGHVREATTCWSQLGKQGCVVCDRGVWESGSARAKRVGCGE
jgi:hypothetical protein